MGRDTANKSPWISGKDSTLHDVTVGYTRAFIRHAASASVSLLPVLGVEVYSKKGIWK